MRINRYRLKDNTTVDKLLKCGFKENEEGDVFVYSTKLYSSIEIQIDIPKALLLSISEINVFDEITHISVLDMYFCQPYTPFYNNFDKEVADFVVLEKVIENYNKVMDNLPIFEKCRRGERGIMRIWRKMKG